MAPSSGLRMCSVLHVKKPNWGGGWEVWEVSSVVIAIFGGRHVIKKPVIIHI